MTRLTRRTLFLVPLLALPAVQAAAAGEEVDGGANSVYFGRKIRIGWAVLRGSAASATKVVLRIVNSAGTYRFVRLDGSNPFTGKHTVLVTATALSNRVDLAVSRARFASFPSAQIRLFKDRASLTANQPDLTVSYVGVPDTTPEFANGPALRAYLGHMLASPRPRQ